MDENRPSDIRLVRLLDANFNRAREAARVLEDAARFLLDDSALTEAAKNLRHDLSTAVLGLPVAGQLSLHRDTPGDVGTGLTVAAEENRATTIEVVNAAFGRLSEALRALEEYAKLLDAVAAGRLKQLRYAAYTLHTRLMRRLEPKAALARVRLCMVIREDVRGGDWRKAAEDALAGGADCLMLREGSVPDAELLRRAQELAALCHRHEALLLVAGRPDIAVLAGADGVEFAQDGLPVDAARRIVGPEAIVGRIAHTVDEVSAAAAEGPDYIAIGPIFGSPSSCPALGLDVLRQAAARGNLPLVAFGGITAENCSDVIAAGAQAVVVWQGGIDQTDVRAATGALRERLA